MIEWVVEAALRSLIVAGVLRLGIALFRVANAQQEKLIWTTPPFLPRAVIISSVMLRGTLAIARQEECDAKIGALLVSRASQNVLSETWEISTIIPRRFISWTTCLPNSDSPWLAPAASPDDPAQWLLLLWVRVI